MSARVSVMGVQGVQVECAEVRAMGVQRGAVEDECARVRAVGVQGGNGECAKGCTMAVQGVLNESA